MGAAVAFLPGVYALVPFQVTRVREALPAKHTAERLLTGVNPHVRFQVLQTRQSLAAEVADKRLASRIVSVVISDAGIAVLRDPIFPHYKSIGYSLYVFPNSHLGFSCRQWCPLPVVCESRRLLMLYYRMSHFVDIKRESIP